MNWRNYRNQILQVSSQFEAFQNTIALRVLNVTASY